MVKKNDRRETKHGDVATLTASTNLLGMRFLQLEETSRTRHTDIFPDQCSQFLREQGFSNFTNASLFRKLNLLHKHD